MEVNDILIELITKIEGIAPHVWEIAVKQVYINAFRNIILVGFVVIAVYVLAKLIASVNRNKEKYSDDFFNSEGITTYLGIIIIILGITILGLVYDIIGMLINPEFYAIKIVLEMMQ